MKSNKLFSPAVILIVASLLLLIVGQFFYSRLDLTQDKRYTLTQTSNLTVSKVNKPLKIQVLLNGELTGDYRILKNEISFLLDELKEENANIEYEFLDPTKDFLPSELESNNLSPIPVKTDKGTLNIYPYAKLTYLGKTKWMDVLINDPSVSFQQLPIASSEKLEYLFMNQIRNITQTSKKKIGLIVHHDELPEKEIDGLGRALAEKYDVGAFLNPILDKSNTLKPSDLKELQKFDALIVAKPTLPFSEGDKLVLDQYVMNGGKMIWAAETVDANMDSIFRSNRILAFPRDLKLNDFFFNYGVRIHPAIVKDLDGAKIVLSDGQTAGNVSYNYFTWPYFELGIKGENNPITASIDPVEFKFANPIELLDNPNIKQTVLLSTSSRSNLQQPMTYIQLSDVDIQNPQDYNKGKIPMAVLLEGNFVSLYASRFERNEFPNFKAKTVNGKMVIISDGDVLRNDMWRGVPMRLGEDKYSVRPDNPEAQPMTYANQTFLMNTIDYLLGDEDFLYLRNRKLEIPLLSPSTLMQDKSTWQWYNVVFPLLFFWLIGGVLLFARKKIFNK